MKTLGSFILCLCLIACGTQPVPEDEAILPESEPVETVPTPEITFDASGEACGGFTGIYCPDGYYCQLEEGQCLTQMDAAGTCQIRPQMCTRDYSPVCGCDGQTYSNSCSAATAGVSIAGSGECASPDTQ